MRLHYGNKLYFIDEIIRMEKKAGEVMHMSAFNILSSSTIISASQNVPSNIQLFYNQ